MTSFVAALEDGLTYVSQVLRRKYQRQSSSKKAAAGVGSPKESILFILLNCDLWETMAGAGETGSGEEV